MLSFSLAHNWEITTTIPMIPARETDGVNPVNAMKNKSTGIDIMELFRFPNRRFKKPTRKATCIPDTATMCDTPHIEKAETVSRFSLKLSVLPNKRALTNGAVSDGNTASIFRIRYGRIWPADIEMKICLYLLLQLRLLPARSKIHLLPIS